MDWLKRLFEEPKTLAVILSSGVIGIMVGIATGAIQKKHGGWPAFFASLAGGVAVAVVVGLATQAYIPSEPLRLAIVGACAAISDDIIGGLKAVGSMIRSDPFGALGRIVDALRGKGTSTSSTPPSSAAREP